MENKCIEKKEFLLKAIILYCRCSGNFFESTELQTWMLHLWKMVSCPSILETTHEDSYRRETTCLSNLWERFCSEKQHEFTYGDTHEVEVIIGVVQSIFIEAQLTSTRTTKCTDNRHTWTTKVQKMSENKVYLNISQL